MRNALERLCAFDHCRVPLPWFVWTRRDDPASRLHRRIMASDPAGPGRAVGPVTVMVAALVHGLRCGRDVWLTWRSLSALTRQGYGVSRCRQLAQLLVAVLRYNFPASLYYRLRLFRLERSRWIACFSHEETTLVLARVEQATAQHGLWTKSGWASFAAAHGIATPPVLAWVRGGTLTVAAGGMLPAGRDYFVKPDRDYSARGGLMLEWNAAKSGWQACGASAAFVPPEGLATFLTEHARLTDHVVQERLRNAPDLADLAPRALVNFRILTQRSGSGTCRMVMASVRFPPGAQPTSDVVGSTLCAPVDPVTGEFGRVECALLGLGAFERHPGSGVLVTGRRSAQWAEMRDRALAAHAEVPWLPTIGWDLIATDRGVFILEANAVWNGNLTQQWGRLPLGETAVPALLLEWIEAADRAGPGSGQGAGAPATAVPAAAMLTSGVASGRTQPADKIKR